MAPDTTIAATGTRTAAPELKVPAADLLSRLTPDDLHPARLTGHHAWHPWNLTRHPPTDHVVRLAVTTASLGAIDRLLEHLQNQLQRPTWPPCPPLQVQRHGTRLDCLDADGRRGVLHVEQEAGRTTAGRDVVTRDGWPIVDEVSALSDRLIHIDADQPDLSDLADLARWVEHKMTVPAPTANVARPLPHLLRTHAAQQPDASARLAALLERGTARADRGDAETLIYLQDQHRRAVPRDLRPALAVPGTRER